jgi:hypothetical protein
MIQFSFTSERYKHDFPEAVAEVISATKSKPAMVPPVPGAPVIPAGQVSLYASFSVYASAQAKAEGGQALETISRSYTCDEADESFSKSEELFLAEVDGTTV